MNLNAQTTWTKPLHHRFTKNLSWPLPRTTQMRGPKPQSSGTTRLNAQDLRLHRQQSEHINYQPNPYCLNYHLKGWESSDQLIVVPDSGSKKKYLNVILILFNIQKTYTSINRVFTMQSLFYFFSLWNNLVFTININSSRSK